MNIALVCVVAHASVPSFLPGTTATLSDRAFVMDRTPGVLRRLAVAIRDRALLIGPHGPTWDEIERAVEAEQAAIAAHIDAYFASHPKPQALAS